MSNNNDYDISDSKDCKTYINQFIQEFTIRSAEIGKGTIIKRALPTDVCSIRIWIWASLALRLTFTAIVNNRNESNVE